MLDKTKKCNNAELIYLFILDLQVVFCKNSGRLSFFIFTCIVSWAKYLLVWKTVQKKLNNASEYK